MILIEPSTIILNPAVLATAAEFIEAAGRTCYKSEEKITPGSADAFVRSILKRGHESVIEHVSVSVRVVCDRGVTHEIVRHRLCAYSQESTRFCDYSKEQGEAGKHVTFVVPPWVTGFRLDYPYCSKSFQDQVLWGEGARFVSQPSGMWARACLDAELQYFNLREAGWRPEQARSVLPNSLKTEIVWTANVREWRHIFRLRASPAAHPQMREVMQPLLRQFAMLCPVLFQDLADKMAR